MQLLRGQPPSLVVPSLWLTTLFLTLSLTACQDAAEKQANAANAPPEQSKTRVQIEQAQQGKITLSKVYLGEVRPKQEATLAAGASGEIEQLTVREGAQVKKGDALVVIDTALVSAEIIEAQAARERLTEEREQALREADRIESLGPEVMPQIEAERERSRARALAASISSQDAIIRRARARRAQHKVTAPFDGVITDRLRDPGDWVGPGTPVMRLVDPANVEVFVPLPAPMAEEIKTGKEVTIIGRNAQITGEVVGIIPELEPTTRTLTLRVAPKEPAAWLLPGDAVDIEILLERTSDGVSLSRDSIVRGVTSTHIMLLTQEDTAKRAEVQILSGNNNRVLLAKHPDLSEGVRVVTHGNERLRPDAPVQIITGDEKEKEKAPSDSKGGSP